MFYSGRNNYFSQTDYDKMKVTVNSTSYTNPDELIITTMSDAVYLGMKNDISFLIANVLNLYEHQSTLNPNMPLRGLFYFADVLRVYIETMQFNIYGS